MGLFFDFAEIENENKMKKKDRGMLEQKQQGRGSWRIKPYFRNKWSHLPNRHSTMANILWMAILLDYLKFHTATVKLQFF